MRKRIEQAQKELEKAEEKRAREAIAAWTQRMQQGVVEVSKWLRSKRQRPGISIDGTETRAEATAKIKQHWQQVWTTDRAAATEEEQEKIAEDMAKHMPKLNISFKQPTAKQLYQAAQKAAGKAGSTDGWSGDEVSCFPLEAWEDFTKIAEQWQKLEESQRQSEQVGWSTSRRKRRSRRTW